MDAAAMADSETAEPTPTHWTLGPNIVRLRRKAGLSQQKVADFIGVTRYTVSHWETGKTMPERKHLIRLALVLKVQPDQLFKRSKPPTR